MHLCNVCKVEKSATEFPKPRPGRGRTCRDCLNEQQKLWREARLGRRRRVGDVEVFTCDTCQLDFERVVTPGAPKRRCEDCLRAEFNRRCRDKWREGYLRRTYGMTLAEYDAMLLAQQGRCGICQTGDPGGRHASFCVDHHHETGAVRELLCTNCNTALGLFREDRLTLLRAIRYLGRHATGMTLEEFSAHLRGTA